MIETVRWKLRTLTVITQDSGATEHARAKAEALNTRLESNRSEIYPASNSFTAAPMKLASSGFKAGLGQDAFRVTGVSAGRLLDGSASPWVTLRSHRAPSAAKQENAT
jgi:hypothetical protein